MDASPCEVCGQPATIHDTALTGGGTKIRHLCPDHGETAWREALGHCTPRLPVAPDLLDNLRRMADEHRRSQDT